MSDENKKDKIYAECLNDGDKIQINGVKLAQPTNISITNLDESISLKWTDPNDVTIEGAPIAEWGGTVIVRKVGSAPKDPNDGLIITDSKIRNQYQTNGFIDTNLINETEYYYGIFPYTEEGVYNCKSNINITPQPIYPSPPTNVQVTPGNTIAKVKFTLPSNATKAKICYSTQQPESNEELYGTIIDNIESPYTIASLENDTTYYVTVYSSNGKRDVASSIIEVTPIELELYEFKLYDWDESNPDSKVVYLGETSTYSPAYMDYEKDQFNYGDWKDAFFMDVKPCMLKYDGTVGYYLDPNNYAMREDGETPSDYNNPEYEGNVMIEFPKIYWKIVVNEQYICTVSISNTKLDNNYHCWSNIDNNGNETDHFYIAAYDGSLVGDRVRSLSGRSPISRTSIQQEVGYCRANNQDDNIIWNNWVYCDLALLRLLLLLISRSTDSQAKFGNGNCSGGDNGIKDSGTLDDKGLFYGRNDNTTCVKVFGIENFWANIFKATAGYVYTNNTQKIKMTHGRSDGSTVDGYNFNGEGYITISNSQISGSTIGINSSCLTQFGILPKTGSGSTSTYFPDVIYYSTGINFNSYALAGGSSGDGLGAGAFRIHLGDPYTWSGWDGTVALSCKPLATVS